MSRMAHDVMEHRLGVDMTHKWTNQKQMHLEVQKSVATAIEVQKLLEVGFIREYEYLNTNQISS